MIYSNAQGRLCPTALALRRSATAIRRTRAAPLTSRSSASNNAAILSRSQSRQYTGYARPTQRVRRPLRTSLTPPSVRHRSSWGRPRGTSIWGWRLGSSWHRPGCKWVRSEGDPRQIPRDKDCPACQEEANEPLELSYRELLWQRQVQFMRSFIEKDPYNALFGRSNDRLKGLISTWEDRLKGWPVKSSIRQELERFGFDTGKRAQANNEELIKPIRDVLRERNTSKPEQPAPASAAPTNSASTTSSASNVAPATAPEPGKPEKPSQPEPAKPIVAGYGRWKVKSVDVNGETIEASGETVFDPISMRMVPVGKAISNDIVKEYSKPEVIKDPTKAEVIQDSTKVEVIKESSKPSSAKATFEVATNDNIVNIPVKTYKEKDSGTKTDADPSSLGRAAFETGEKPIELPQPPMQLSIATKKLDVINRVEKGLSLARSQLKALVTFHVNNSSPPPKLMTLGKAISGLRGTDMALRSLQRFHNLDTQSQVTSDGAKPVSSIPPRSLAELRERRFPRPKENEPSQTKRTMEQSWTKEHEKKKKEDADAANSAPPPKSSGDTGPPTQKEIAQRLRAAEIPHFKQKELSLDQLARDSYKRIVKRDIPLKHMSAHALSVHRAALAKSWKRRAAQTAAKPETPAERKLKEEIQAQKAAYTAFENKWSKKNDHSPSASIASKPETVSEAKESARSEPVVERIQGVPHEVHNTPSRPSSSLTQDPADILLVRSIREIYENAYGVITTQHRQGKLKEDIKEATPRSSTTAAADSSKLDAPVAAKSSLFAPTVSAATTSLESKSAEAAQNVVQDTEAGAAPISPKEELRDTSETSTIQPLRPSTTRPHAARFDKALYQILAYDTSTQEVHTAVASSSFTPPSGERMLSVSDALVKLNQPAKFLPHLAKHQANGYEIVSANKNLLVFKRMHPATAAEVSRETVNVSTTAANTETAKSTDASHVRYTQTNPVDGLKNAYDPLPPAQAGNFASPTGFVNHDVFDVRTPQADAKPSARSNIRVRKEEAVFSGGLNKMSADADAQSGRQSQVSSSSLGGAREHPPQLPHNGAGSRDRHGRFRRRRGRVLGRMLLFGTWTALCCYGTGYAIEELRNWRVSEEKLAAETAEEGATASAAHAPRDRRVPKSQHARLVEQTRREQQALERKRALVDNVVFGAEVVAIGAIIWGLVELFLRR